MKLTPYQLRQWIEPTLYSLSGKNLSNIEDDNQANVRGPVSCLRAVAITITRIWFTFVTIVAAGLDLLAWMAMTIQMKRMCRIGIKTHFINLISILATPLFALTIPFGYVPKVKSKRSFLVISTNEITFDAERGNMGRLVQARTRINLPDEQGITPLMYASVPPDNSRAIVNLVRFGADPNLETPSYEAPLFLAIAQRSISNVQALLSVGADPNNSTRVGIVRICGEMIGLRDSVPFRPLEFLLWNLRTQRVAHQNLFDADSGFPYLTAASDFDARVTILAKTLIFAGAECNLKQFISFHEIMGLWNKVEVCKDVSMYSDYLMKFGKYLEENSQKNLSYYPPIFQFYDRTKSYEGQVAISIDRETGSRLLKQSRFIQSIAKELEETQEAYLKKKTSILLQVNPMPEAVCRLTSEYWMPYLPFVA